MLRHIARMLVPAPSMRYVSWLWNKRRSRIPFRDRNSLLEQGRLIPEGKPSRIFLVLGMAHCGGGPSLDHFDILTAIINWVEKGAAPDFVSATGKAFSGRSRPLCACPKHAQYIGTGDTQDARNFRCQ